MWQTVRVLCCNRRFSQGPYGGADINSGIYFSFTFTFFFDASTIFEQHGELIKIFFDLAVREGVEIRQNANVIYANPHYASVKLDTGETVSGDIIIAADGYTSSLRSAMGYPEPNNVESDEKVLYVAFTLDTSLLKDDPSSKILLNAGTNVSFISS